jgi:hypothetical protein
MSQGGRLGIRLARAAVAALWLGVWCAPAAVLADEGEALDIRVETSVTADNNVARSRGEGNRLSDVIYNVNVGKGHVIPLTDNTRISLLGTAGVEVFNRYSGLSRFFLGIQGEFQYRPSGEFDAPTFGIFGRAAADLYQSSLRDGYRYNVGARVLQPLTDRVDLFGSLAYNVRDGRSKVFDNKDYSGRLQLDYSLTQKGTLYLSGEYRRGETVSTARPELAFVDIAEAIVRDDAFTDTERQAYRLRARTAIATLGYSLGLDEDQALDFSIRWIRSTALSRPSFPGAETIRYFDTQATVAYLIRF